MYKEEAREAAPICDRVLGKLLEVAPTRGRSGSNLRTAVGDFLANSEVLIQHDLSGPPLDAIFELARQANVSRAQMKQIRFVAVAENPVSLGATLIKNSLINFALATEARILVDTTFVSRQDVDQIKKEMNEGFAPMEEIAADDMDQLVYKALVELHAAVAFYLAEMARPLPRIVQYRFHQTLPSLVVAYKLYSNAGRADEVRAENKIVHPAFMPLVGRALSK